MTTRSLAAARQKDKAVPRRAAELTRRRCGHARYPRCGSLSKLSCSATGQLIMTMLVGVLYWINL